MLKIIAFIALGALITTLARWGWSKVYSFKAQNPSDYADQGPAFDIRTILSGPIQAAGVIFDYTGRVNTRFVAEMTGTWDGDKGVLAENFQYSSGRKQLRRWTLRVGQNGQFTATAPDVIGVGQGHQLGSSVRLTYRIQLEAEAGGHVLDVVDWMYLIDDDVVINKSEFRKFGVKVGELVATFRKED